MVNVAYALLCVALIACGEDRPEGSGIAVRDAWIREPPPRSPAAGYLTIEHRSDKSVELVGAETAAAERTEIHLMEHKDGRMTMRKAESLTIPAEGNVELKSGGTHLMLMDLRQPLKAGAEVELVLRFGDGTQKRLAMPVRLATR